MARSRSVVTPTDLVTNGHSAHLAVLNRVHFLLMLDTASGYQFN